MKKAWILLLLVGALLAGRAWALEVHGVKVEESVQVGKNELTLNGAGVRKKFFIKVYVAALYAPQKSNSASALLETGPRRMALTMLRDLDVASLFGALKEGLARNLEPAVLAGFQTQVDALGTVMARVGNVKAGDRVVLDMGPEGLAVFHNGEARGTVPGAPFAAVLLSIWLGPHPVDNALKEALLGG